MERKGDENESAGVKQAHRALLFPSECVRERNAAAGPPPQKNEDVGKDSERAGNEPSLRRGDRGPSSLFSSELAPLLSLSLSFKILNFLFFFASSLSLFLSRLGGREGVGFFSIGFALLRLFSSPSVVWLVLLYLRCRCYAPASPAKPPSVRRRLFLFLFSPLFGCCCLSFLLFFSLIKNHLKKRGSPPFFFFKPIIIVRHHFSTQTCPA